MVSPSSSIRRFYRNNSWVKDFSLYAGCAIAPFVIAYYWLIGASYLMLVIPAVSYATWILQKYWKKTPKPVRTISLVAIVGLFGWAVMTASMSAHAFWFTPFETLLTEILNAFGVTGLDQIPGWVTAFLKALCLVGFGGIVVSLFVKGRDDEDETRRSIGKLLQMVLKFILAAAMLGILFT